MFQNKINCFAEGLLNTLIILANLLVKSLAIKFFILNLILKTIT